MAISSSTRKAGPFLGNDATTVFPFAFKVFAAADLRVVRTNALGIESDLVLDTDYTVTLNSNQDNDPGGTVTRGTALPTGERLTITSDVEALQPLVLTNNGGFYPRVINDAFDKITIIAQQLIEQVGRSLKLPISSSASATLPDPVANRLIAWNSSANGFTNVNPASLATVAAYADAYIDLFTGNGTQTAFTLTHDPAVLANLSVSISGVVQVGGEDFTWVGTTLTFVVAPPTGTRIQVRYTRAIPPADLASAVAAAEADRVATAADRVQTGLDRIATAADVVSAEADRVATAADAVATAADRVQTGLDRAQTGLDRVQTGLDVATAASILASRQPLDADLTALAALASAADKMPYATGAQTWALTDLTAAGRALLDDANAEAQRTTLAAVGTVELAASTGAALVGLIQSDTGAVARTAQAKARDTLSFADFGAVGDNSTDDTTAIGLAITAAAARAATGGVQARVSGVPGKTYKITAAIALATFVDIDLNGSEVVQYTANTPIFSAPGTDIQQWSLRNGTLSYNTAQTSGQTSGIGLRTANGANSYMFEVSNLDIRDACKGVAAPTTAGTFTFLGTFTNVRVLDAADWSWEILCNSGAGANTNLSFTNVWAVQTGTPKAASKGFKIVALSQGRFNSMAVDHVALQAFNFESCTGDWGCLSVESCDFVGPVEPVVFFESPGTVASLKFIDNTYTSTGGDIYMLRPGCNSTGYLQVDSFIESGGVFTGANTYEVNPTAGMRIVNNYAANSRSPVFADFGIRRKIIRWNGIDLMRVFGSGQVEVFTTSAPASEAWIVGDTATNTAPAAGGTPGWKCVTAGTPGTWKAMANLAA